MDNDLTASENGTSDMMAGASDSDIAIIGMVGRFPRAGGLDAFWRILVEGSEAIAEFDAEEAKAAVAATGADPAIVDDPHYVLRGGELADIDMFDASFFGVYPREAEIMDPQHRVFLELAWEALEHAGYDPGTYPGSIGVYAGSGMNTYLLFNLARNRTIRDTVQGYQLTIGNDKDYLPTRVAYKLNLRGPAVNVQTACSTSLVATHLACKALLAFECDMALAGGVTIRLPQRGGYLHQEGGILSADGHCRAFDADAGGTVGGNGAGIIVLKRLVDALEEGDTIHAIIKGTALNNDGANKVGYTAPSVDGQTGVISAAQGFADIDPRTITYIEAHGTGTALGDPIEVAALTQVFRAATDDTQFCALGSLKTNFGHLDAAAGVASLIKTTLALAHRQMPPTANFRAPNPNIDFAASPFFVNTALTPWESDGPRRAGVSSFGIGGTNAHAVLQEAPELPPTGPSRPWQLLTLTGRSPLALDAVSARLAEHLERDAQLSLADAAYTLQVGRQPLAHRRIAVVRDVAEAIRVLKGETGGSLTGDAPRAQSVAFMFTGQGSQYAGMGAGLYTNEPIFAEAVDRCAMLLRPHLRLDLRTLLFPAQFNGPADADEQLKQTGFTQPALFVIEYALAELWLNWGVRPAAMIGHSIGEYVAAHLSGVMSLEDALAVVAARGHLMGSLPPGAMLSLPLSEETTRSLLREHPLVTVATINAPGTCVVAGPTEAVATVREALTAQGIEGRPLHTSHAFHSAMMDPILSAFAEVVRRVPLHPPQIPYISNVSGDWITVGEATDPAYYAQHLRQAVRFGDGLATLAAEPTRALLEVGPGRTLTTLARMHPATGRARAVIPSLRRPQDDRDDVAVLLEALGQLWLTGVIPDWAAFYAREERRRIPLPTYPFERQRYWVAPTDAAELAHTPARKTTDVMRWFYAPSWVRTPLEGQPAAPRRTLILTDAGTRAADILAALPKDAIATVACAGEGFAWTPDGYTIRPGDPGDARRLFQALADEGATPETITVLWAAESDVDFDAAQARGFDTLLALARSWEAVRPRQAVQINVVANGVFDVTGGETLRPPCATLLGAARTIPQELPHIAVRLIDIGDATPARIAVELTHGTTAVTALRGGHRWTEHWQPLMVNAATGAAGVRAGGVYLITGGLGRIGGVFAEHLARHGARLVLVDRTPLPPRAAWGAAGRFDARTLRAIARVETLEALGAAVQVVAADVADPTALAAAVAVAEEAFGGLHGVIHAAGTVGAAAIRLVGETGAQERDAQFGPKVHGVQALDAALAGRDLDFILLMSSISTVLGGLGFAAYAGANAFMEAFAAQKQREGDRRWVSAAWDGWQFAEELALGKAAAGVQAFAITPEEGVAAFEALLALGGNGRELPQVIVSTGDLVKRIAGLNAAPNANDAPAAGPATATGHARPNLRTVYIAPEDEIEQAIAADWSQVLGITPVGAHDDFFELGGHSLLATQLVSRLRDAHRVELPLNKLFETPTVAGLAALIRAAKAADVQPLTSIVPLADREAPPLSYGQQRLWFLDQLSPGSPLYNNFAALRLKGAGLDPARLEASLNAVAARHEALRTIFGEQGGIPTQRILSQQHVIMPVVDLRGLDGERETRLLDLAQLEARKPFDLTTGPLFRATLIQLDDDEAVLFFTMHHIVSDGWSVGVLIREVIALYRDPERGIASLPELPIQYADYAAWQRDRLTGAPKESELAYWRERLGDDPTALELPTDRPRPAVQTANGANVWFELPASVYRGLEALAQGEGATLFMALTAGLQTLLHRYTGQDDIAIGTPIANRDRAETAPLIGFLLNTLVLRTDLAGAPTFRTLLNRVKEVALGAYAHSEIPFETLVETLQPTRDMSRSPYFQVMFDLQAAPLEGISLEGIELSRLNVDGGTAKFDLALSMEYGEETLGGFLNYNTDLFDRGTITALVEHLRTLLTAAAATPDLSIADLPLMSEAERQRVVVEWNTTAQPVREERSVIEQFAAQAVQRPQQPAVVMADESGVVLSYATLDARAEQLAQRLGALGVQADQIVALLVERNAGMVTAIAGVLKSGAAFLPIDTGYPRERIAFTLADSGAVALVTQRDLPLPEWQGPVVYVDDLSSETRSDAASQVLPHGRSVQPDGAAYCIYTSGSTGQPKGVIIEHGGLAQHLRDVAATFGLAPGDRILQFAAYTFDQGIEQVLTALTQGCTLVVRGREIWPPADFPRVIAEYRLNSINLPPAYWNQVLQEWVKTQAPIPAGQLKSVISGGDVLTKESLALWQRTPAAGARLINAYGPTETTVTATTFDVTGDWYEHTARPAPIGRPLANRVAYIVDKYGNPTPPGVPGELLLGGNGVARGYLNREALTAEKFVAPPRRLHRGATPPAAARLYRTGDLARYTHGGDIEFLGRLDQQVKIRGFRIELGEIEAALETYPGVREVVVVARAEEGGGQRLVAYLTHEGEAPRPAALREHLARTLPTYMAPSAFVMLDRMPLNAAGKVDRRTLPAPTAGVVGGADYVAPRSPVELQVAAIWQGVLGAAKVGLHDNFFELGGHSLLATQILSQLREHYPVNIPLRLLFEKATVASLAALIEEALLAQQSDEELAALLAEIDGLSDEEARAMLASGGQDE